MRQNEYSILNKQYSKEEYEKLAAKICEHMIETREWGAFFPSELRPFAYNESVAQEFFPMQKKEILNLGWKWKDDIDQFEKNAAKYKIADQISDVADDILKETLVCEVTGRSYKIVPQELKFYRQMNLPVPRIAPKERLSGRFQFKAQRKFFDRNCSKCGKNIKTVFSKEYAEKVYCEECYLKAVY